MFNESYNLPASSGIARILHLNPDRHVSYIVQSGQVTFSRAQPVQKPMDDALCRLRRRAQALKRTSRAIAVPATHHLLKCPSQFLKGRAGKNVSSGNQTCGAESAGKGKGCDIGYA